MSEERAVSRRDFLKLAGVAGATIGAGAGLGGLISACGGDDATTTTGAATTATTAAGGTDTTAGATTTSVQAGAEQGKGLKVGIVVPMTGPLAEFGAPTEYLTKKVEQVTGGKIVTKDGKEREIKWISNDSQSDSNRAAQVTGDMIQNDQVNIILAEGGPDSVLGPADQCEAMGCPGLFCNLPWTAFTYGRNNDGKTPFKWTYATTVGTQENGKAALSAFENYKPGTNKKVALLYPNNANGIEYSDMKTGIPPLLTERGYTYVMPDLYPPGAEDFTAQISVFKKEGCEMLMGSGVTPEFSNFFNQAVQQGFTPPLVSNGIALLFPSAPAAIGPTAENLVMEIAFDAKLPYKSPLTGQTCQELWDEYESTTGKQGQGILNAIRLYEWTVDVFKRAENVEDPTSIMDAVATTKFDSAAYPIDFTKPVGDKQRPHPNVYVCPVLAGQWQKGTGKWPFEQVIVGYGNFPEFKDVVALGSETKAMTYGK
jgi:branched-chain amino acid transport system substrate-binding protein